MLDLETTPPEGGIPAWWADWNGIPTTTPDQWGEGQPGQVTPPANPDGGSADQQQANGQWSNNKYKEIVATMWEDAIDEMVSKYEKVNELLENSENIKDISKEELHNLYQLRDKLQNNLSQILPALEERNKSQMSEHLAWLPEDPSLKDYTNTILNELDSPEEAEAFVEVVKKVWEIAKGWGQGDWQPGTVPPANLNDALKWWQGGAQQPPMDIEKAMMSTDPAVRKQAMQAFDEAIAASLPKRNG